jgi:hypothetical protein
MKYLAFIRHPESYRDRVPPPSLMEAMGRFIEQSRKNGSLVDTGGLLPSKDGLRVRLSNNQLSVTDGPFSETKEIIGGWAILEAASKAQVTEFSVAFMELHRVHWPGFEGECEVRAMFAEGAGP